MSVWDVLGHGVRAVEIRDRLLSTERLTFIKGPPGSGKSTLAKAVAGLWDHRGDPTIIAQGDRARDEEPYFALRESVILINDLGDLAAELREVAAALGEAVSGSTGVVGAVVRSSSALTSDSLASRTLALSASEQDVLARLSRRAGSGNLLLIADNLHWWDRESLLFLQRMQDPALQSWFPFLQGLRVLGVLTPPPHQTVSNPLALNALSESNRLVEFEIDRPDRDTFAQVLLALGAGSSATPEVTSAVYDLTGGHLALARPCAKKIHDGGASAFVAQHESSEFIAGLLSDRIRAMGLIGNKALEVLSIAAAIGLQFRRSEIACAWKDQGSEASDLLRILRKEHLIELDEHTGSFVHTYYRDHFESISAPNQIAVHEALIDCFREISPGNYELRYQNAQRAEATATAGVLAVQAALARLRSGSASSKLPEALLATVGEADLGAALAVLLSAMELLDAGRDKEASKALDALPSRVAPEIAAETDYLRARALMGTRAASDRQDALELLENWDGFETEEQELGTRLEMQKLYALAMDIDKRPGRQMERKIIRRLQRRVAIDPTAEDAIARLDRTSPSLYPPDNAMDRVADAAVYFGDLSGEPIVAHPIELYKSLVTLVAQEVANKRYSDAVVTGKRLAHLIDRYPAGTFPRLDYAYSNLLLGKFRNLDIDAESAALTQREIVSTYEAAGDPFYPQSNLAVFLALSGEIDEPVSILKKLEAKLDQRSNPEPSMKYLLASNRLSIQFCKSPADVSTSDWSEIGDLIARIPYPGRDAYVLRHQLLAEVIESKAQFTAQELDRHIHEAAPDQFGPLWDHIGHGLWLSAVELWY